MSIMQCLSNIFGSNYEKNIRNLQTNQCGVHMRNLRALASALDRVTNPYSLGPEIPVGSARDKCRAVIDQLRDYPMYNLERTEQLVTDARKSVKKETTLLYTTNKYEYETYERAKQIRSLHEMDKLLRDTTIELQLADRAAVTGPERVRLLTRAMENQAKLISIPLGNGLKHCLKKLQREVNVKEYNPQIIYSLAKATQAEANKELKKAYRDASPSKIAPENNDDINIKRLKYLIHIARAIKHGGKMEDDWV